MHEKQKEQYLRLADRIAKWITGKVEEANARGVVVGLSGGIDSAVVASIARRSLPRECVLGFALPCKGAAQDLYDAREVAGSLDMPLIRFSLSDLFKKFMYDFKISTEYDPAFRQLKLDGLKMAEANLKARLRMVTLYYYANLLNFLVLGTGNKSEIMIGYLTKYGDGGIDIEPLGDLYKTEIWELARALGNIPKAVIDKPPSAGLWEGQTDEEEIGFPYDRLDATLKFLEQGKEQKINDPTGIFDKVLSLMGSSSHKRKVPPIFSVDRKEFNLLALSY